MSTSALASGHRHAHRSGGRTAAYVVVVLAAALLGAALTVVGATTPLLLPVLPVAVGIAALVYRTPLGGVCLVLALAPVALYPVVGPLQVGQALVLPAVGLLALRRLLRGETPLPLPRELLWGVGLLVVALLASLQTVSLELTVKQDVALVAGLAFAAAIVAVCGSRRSWVLAVRSLLVGGVAVCGPALLAVGDLEARFGGSVVQDRARGVFEQPNELGTFAMIITLAAAGLLLGAPTRLDRVLASVALVTGLGALLLSLSRGAWIGFVCGSLVLLVLVPRARKLVGVAAGCLVLLAAVLGAFAPETSQVDVITKRLSSFTGQEVNPYDDRPRIWAEGRREVADRPLLGQGPGSFPVASALSTSYSRTVGADHAHDVLLTVAAETGLLGAAALVGMTLVCARRFLRGLRLARRQEDPLVLGVLAGTSAGLVALVGQGIVDFTLRNPLVAQTAWAVLGLSIAGALLAHASRPISPDPAP